MRRGDRPSADAWGDRHPQKKHPLLRLLRPCRTKSATLPTPSDVRPQRWGRRRTRRFRPSLQPSKRLRGSSGASGCRPNGHTATGGRAARCNNLHACPAWWHARTCQALGTCRQTWVSPWLPRGCAAQKRSEFALLKKAPREKKLIWLRKCKNFAQWVAAENLLELVCTSGQ